MDLVSSEMYIINYLKVSFFFSKTKVSTCTRKENYLSNTK